MQISAKPAPECIAVFALQTAEITPACGHLGFPACVRVHADLVPNMLQNASRTKRRKQMRSSSKDQIKGKFHEVKGKAKQAAGQVTDNPKLEAEGQAEKLTGKIQKKVGQVEKVLEK
jgi:uncharacterized protein YjbJ (UPF0337 family)